MKKIITMTIYISLAAVLFVGCGGDTRAGDVACNTATVNFVNALEVTKSNIEEYKGFEHFIQEGFIENTRDANDVWDNNTQIFQVGDRSMTYSEVNPICGVAPDDRLDAITKKYRQTPPDRILKQYNKICNSLEGTAEERAKPRVNKYAAAVAMLCYG